MSDTSPIDLAPSSQVMELQNGSSSLDTSPRVDTHELVITTTLSSPDSESETVDYVQSQSVVPVVPFGGMVVMMPSSEESDQTTPPPPSSPPEEANLLTLLRIQLEYYFSKDNLATDKYLLSQMDNDHFVPLSVLANFNQVKRLSCDMALIIDAIKDSGTLKLDSSETKVKAIPEKRCILILREIPQETPREDVFQLFSSGNCPKFMSCDFAENDCWYVTFSGEDEAQEAYRYLREEVRSFLGKPIRARIKNTTVQRAASLPKTRPQYSVQPVPFYQQPVVWPPPYYSEPPYAPPFINGFPSHTGFNVGGQSSQSATRFVLSNNNTSVSGVASNNSSSAVKDVSSRKNHSSSGNTSNTSSSNSSSAVKSRHSVSSDLTEKRSSGAGHFTGVGREGRLRRDDDRDRTRNLPNRFRNKRNEESVAGMEDKSDKHIDKEKVLNERGNTRQRFQNRTQPKLDLAPTNFPPLPGQTDAILIPPPPPLPPASPEANLADIVKGRHALSLPLTPPVVLIDAKSTAVSKPAQSKSLPSPVSTTPTTGVPPVPPVPTAAVQVPKTESKVLHRAGEKESTSTVKQNVSHNVQVVRGQSSNGGRSRYRDVRDSRKPNTSSSRDSRPSQKQPPKVSTSSNASVQAPPPPLNSCDEVDETFEEKTDDPPKSERMSYAQMAGQRKSKSSLQGNCSTIDVGPPSSSLSPPVSPNEASSESNTPSPHSPPPPLPFQSEPADLS